MDCPDNEVNHPISRSADPTTVAFVERSIYSSTYVLSLVDANSGSVQAIRIARDRGLL